MKMKILAEKLRSVLLSRDFWLEIIAISPAIFFFLLFKTYAAAPCAGDENIYYYLGQRVSRGGLTPYSDFLFTHPPFHLAVATLWTWIHPFTPLWGKLGSIFPSLLSIVFVYIALRKADFPRIASALGPLLLAFSYNWLSVSTHFTGINWTTLMLVAGVTALSVRRQTAGGISLACATLTGFHVIPAVALVNLFAALRHRLKVWRLWLASAGSVLGVHLLCLALWGKEYFGPVFEYHLNKPSMARGGASAVNRFFWNEYHLTAMGIFGLLWCGVLLYRHKRENKQSLSQNAYYLALYSFAIIAAQFLAVYAISRVYTYYLQPMLPFFAILSVYFLYFYGKLIRDAFKDMRKKKKRLSKLAASGVVLLLLAGAFAYGENLESRIGYYSKEYGKTFDYPWRDSKHLPQVANALVQGVFHTPERTIGRWYCSITHYLWHEMRTEDPTPMLEKFIERSKDKPGRIFGDNSSVPYIAMASGRLISQEQDTNSMIFRSNLVPISGLIEKLSDDPPAWIIINPKRGIWGIKPFREWVGRYYKAVAEAKTGKKDKLILLEINSEQ